MRLRGAVSVTTETPTRKRVLLVAPTIDGQDVGEAWVAYQWARHLADQHDLTVLTYHKRGKTPAARQLPGVRVVEWSEPRGLGRFERFNSILKPGYVPFYVRARRWIRQALRNGERFDVAHQPLPVAMRYPSPAAGLGIPLVMGPVGGGLQSPPAFVEDEGSTPWYMRLRALDAWRLRHDPLLRRTYASANCVLGIAPYVAERLDDVALRRFETMSETALTALPDPTPSAEDGGPLRLLHVGRLVRTKGLRDVLRAVSLLPDLDLRLDVVGEGPERTVCEELIRELGLTDRVVMHGWLERSAVTARYLDGDVFVFPSYREPGGNVVFEAMGHGLSLVVCDRGGPGAAVDTSCAEIVPVSTPEALAEDVAAALRRLAADPERRRAMGQAARERAAATALWPAKVAAAGRLYDELASGPAVMEASHG
jgi:glycosyltransferase involved in cell wall biosynthesis